MGPRASAGKTVRGIREPRCCSWLDWVEGEVIFSAMALCMVLYSCHLLCQPGGEVSLSPFSRYGNQGLE